MHSRKGQYWAFSKAIEYLERQTQTTFSAEEIEFNFPLSLHIHGITLSQESDRLATIKQLDISFAYWHLLEGRLICSSLHADGVHFLKLPAPSFADSPPSEAEWGTSIAPLYLKIENLLISDVSLSPAVLEQLTLPSYLADLAKHSSFYLKGSLGNNPFKNNIFAQFAIKIIDVENKNSPLYLEAHIHDRQLAFSLHSHRFPYAFALKNEVIPLDTTLAFFASAPLSTWQKGLQNRLTEEESIEGQFKLISTFEGQDPWLQTILGEKSLIKSKYAWRGYNSLHLWDLKIELPLLNLKGEGTLADNQIYGTHFEGRLHHLENLSSHISKDLKGELALKGHLSGSLAQPTLAIQSSSDSLAIQGQIFQNIQSTLKVSLEQGNLDGLFNFLFEYEQQPCRLAASFYNSSDSLSLSHFQMDFLHSYLKGNLTFSHLNRIWDGELQAYTGHLKDLSPFLALSHPIEGEVHLNAYFKPIQGVKSHQGIDLELTGQSLHWKNLQADYLQLNMHLEPMDDRLQSFHASSRLQGKKVSWEDKYSHELTVSMTHEVDFVNANLTNLSTQLQALGIKSNMFQAGRAYAEAFFPNPLQEWEGQLRFSSQDLKVAGQALNDLTGETRLHPLQERWPFRLKGKGKGNSKDNWNFATEGSWRIQEDSSQLQIDYLEGNLKDHPFALLEPLQVLHQNEMTEIRNIHAKFGEAELSGEIHKERENVACHFQTNEIPTRLFHLVWPNLPLDGKASLRGYLEGPIQQPSGQLQVFLHRVNITEAIFANQPLIEGEIGLDIQESGIQLQSTLHGIGNTPVLLHGTLPFALSLSPPKLQVSEITPFSMTIEAEGDLDPYLQLFYNDTTNLSGQAKIAFNLSGQINAPRVQGSIDFHNGSYESLSTGAIYKNIQARLVGDGSRVLLDHFYAQDNKHGSITANGSIELDKAKEFPFEFHIHPKEIFIVESDYANISAGGSLILSGNHKRAKLQGDLTTDTLTIHMEEALPKQIKTVEVKYINLPEGDSIPNHLESQNSSSSIVDLDIKLHLPGKVFIEGKHLTSEWKGDIAITGTADNPLLNGDLRISKGEYNFNGKIFNFNQGNIHFAGPPGKKTSLYVVASKEIDRIRAEIIVKGPISKPVISFRSNPPLSQREILSYILFNRGIADITSDQGDQLSQSFISLNEGEQTSSSDDFLTRLRNNIGIDRLDITSSDSDNKDFSLQVGKYITESIFVSINKSISDIGNRVSIEANLRKNLKAQAEVELGGDAQGKVSLKWKKDY
ncbi:translocation/assembly module TamB domain-containing protein [Candidatus Protochlamydia phocaeensis]|uniref:translocation/assembly module TamB domain-containing protein n=1 Tax=Candidatus Protochlamydia phocaeensis TaxID=1414722 RepID=UPI001896747C|nr:translocation/assembly module TamB [Candidatus Protochlamydia phocaeensis]